MSDTSHHVLRDLTTARTHGVRVTRTLCTHSLASPVLLFTYIQYNNSQRHPPHHPRTQQSAMPAGHLLSPPLDPSQLPDDSVSALQIVQQATKRCSACQGPLNVDASAPSPLLGQVFSSETIPEPASLCSSCREACLAQQQQQCATLMVCPTAPAQVVQDGACDIDVPLRVLQRSSGVRIHDDMQHEADSSSSSDEDMRDEEREDGVFPTRAPADRSVHIGSSVSQSTPSVPVPISTSSHQHQHSYPRRNPSPISVSPTLRPATHPRSPIRQTHHSQYDREHKHDYDDGYPDPLVDITRLRARSKGYRCLQPGATFKGTQRSGRNSYDVNVTIVVSLS